MGNVRKGINANVTQVLVEHAVSKVGRINTVTQTLNTVTRLVNTVTRMANTVTRALNTAHKGVSRLVLKTDELFQLVNSFWQRRLSVPATFSHRFISVNARGIGALRTKLLYQVHNTLFWEQSSFIKSTTPRLNRLWWFQYFVPNLTFYVSWI